MEGLIAALEGRIAQAPAGGMRCCLIAELAIAQAQAGRLAQAESSSLSLKSEAQRLGLPRFLIYGMISDGVIEYYKTLSALAHDKLRRGFLLAKASGDVELMAIASVWLVHTAFNFQLFDDLEMSLLGAGEAINLVPDQCAARYCLSVADIAQYVGRDEAGAFWYKCARALSRITHDHALMVAIESNRLLLRLDRIRFERALGNSVPPSSIATMKTELRSLRALHAGLGSSALPELLLWAEATEHQLSGRFEAAVGTLRQMHAVALEGRSAIGSGQVEIELRVCELMAGFAAPNALPECLLEKSLLELPDDEALIAIALLNSALRSAGIAEESTLLRARFEAARRKCEDDVARLRRLSVGQDRLEEKMSQLLDSARARQSS